MKFFLYDNVNEGVTLNDEGILLIKEFAALMNPTRNKTKEDKTGLKRQRAFKEFSYIYLFFDWNSPYFQYSEQDKNTEAFKDSGLTQEEFDDELFREACRKYDALQNSSKIGNLLKASYNTIDKITHYLNTIDLNERDDVTGKPIYKTKDVIAEMSSASKLIDAIKVLESSFKKDLEPDGGLRGDTAPGMFD
jgi:hypothetical protein